MILSRNTDGSYSGFQRVGDRRIIVEAESARAVCDEIAEQVQAARELVVLDTVCSWCQRLKQPYGWIETTGPIPGPVSHGICPECSEREFGE